MWRKGKYRQPVAMLLGKKSDRRGLAPGREGTRCQIAVAFRDEALPDHLLDDQGQGRADVADDIRRATFLSGFEIPLLNELVDHRETVTAHEDRFLPGVLEDD